MLLSRIKTNLGIMHELLDDEIEALIVEARAELARLGVPEDVAESDEGTYPTVDSAIVVYACYRRMLGTAEGDGYLRAWEYQSDCLRKTVFE